MQKHTKTPTLPIPLQVARITTLSQLVALMTSTVIVRRRLLAQILTNEPLDQHSVECLHVAHELLSVSLPDPSDKRLLLAADEHTDIAADISYEIDELAKDLRFVVEPRDRFIQSLVASTTDSKEWDALFTKLQGRRFRALISDRDGTINNYCARYETSVQSLYNAVLLQQFVSAKTDLAVVLTSAPLKDVGILDITVNPSDAIIFAASKGREFVDLAGKPHRFAIDPQRDRLLSAVYDEIARLVAQPRFSLFRLIGSGLQKKFGQITIARQDHAASITSAASQDWLTRITDIVKSYDVHGEFLRIEDTGKDIEIIVTTPDGSGDYGFDKRDGVRFVAAELGISGAPLLACGDTASDIALAQGVREIDPTAPVLFVTTDTALKARVIESFPDAHFVPDPDSLIGLLALLSHSS